jgi:beta-galactosidase beta subunit
MKKQEITLFKLKKLIKQLEPREALNLIEKYYEIRNNNFLWSDGLKFIMINLDQQIEDGLYEIKSKKQVIYRTLFRELDTLLDEENLIDITLDYEGLNETHKKYVDVFLQFTNSETVNCKLTKEQTVFEIYTNVGMLFLFIPQKNLP